MKKIIMYTAVCTLALSLAACQSAPTKSMSQAKAAISAAVMVNNKAKKAFYEWRETGKLIKKAKKASNKGDFDKAVKLANRAERHAKHAVAQSKIPTKLYY